jgi:hypothetical protein
VKLVIPKPPETAPVNPALAGTPPIPAPVASPPPSTVPAAPAALPTLDELKSRWPEILQVLRKRKPAAASVAETSWILDGLDGKKLTVCCTSAQKFQTDSMKNAFPDLGAAIQEVMGTALILVAGAPKAAPVDTAEKPAAPPPAAPADPGDLFAVLKNRFGGIEIDPSKAREPK